MAETCHPGSQSGFISCGTVDIRTGGFFVLCAVGCLAASLASPCSTSSNPIVATT